MQHFHSSCLRSDSWLSVRLAKESAFSRLADVMWMWVYFLGRDNQAIFHVLRKCFACVLPCSASIVRSVSGKWEKLTLV